jgi:hypothetical protein
MTSRLTPVAKRGFTVATSQSLRPQLYPSASCFRWRPPGLQKLGNFSFEQLTSSLPSFSLFSSRRTFRTLTAMATNGDARPKRKHSPVSFLDRPAKHLKPEASAPTPGDSTPQNGTVYNVESDLSAVPILNALPPTADSPEWQATIEKVVKSVVSIHFCQTCSFDTDLSMSSQATGFVVDAERGYIMTNRHVACAGPFWGYCIFDNHEEVRITTCISERN